MLAALREQRRQLEQQLAEGDLLLKRRKVEETRHEQEAQREEFAAQLTSVLASASAPDATTRQLCAQSVAAYLKSCADEIDSQRAGDIARCIATLLDGESDAAVRREAGSTFQVFETLFAQRAAKLYGQLSDEAQAELALLCSTGTFATPDLFRTPSSADGVFPSLPTSAASRDCSDGRRHSFSSAVSQGASASRASPAVPLFTQTNRLG